MDLNKRDFLSFIAAGAARAPLATLTATPAEAAESNETTYARVTRTGTIRCGYTPYSVGLQKDANTGKLSGIYKDILEAVAKKLSLDVTYTEEIGWGEQIKGLNVGRYDIIGSPVSITGPRSRSADYTMPLYYSPVWMWVKAGRKNFDGLDRDHLNTPALKIATLDGEQTDAMADFYFPKAHKVTLPQNSDFASLMMDVATDKADMTFAEPLTVHEFLEKNPGSLRQVQSDKPLTLVPNILLIRRGEFEFKSMMNNALTELFLSGFIDQTIDTYEKYKNSYVRSSEK